jgi:hypothetical protein
VRYPSGPYKAAQGLDPDPGHRKAAVLGYVRASVFALFGLLFSKFSSFVLDFDNIFANVFLATSWQIS